MSLPSDFVICQRTNTRTVPLNKYRKMSVKKKSNEPENDFNPNDFSQMPPDLISPLQLTPLKIDSLEQEIISAVHNIPLYNSQNPIAKILQKDSNNQHALVKIDLSNIPADVMASQLQVPVLQEQTNDSSGSPPTSILAAKLSEPCPSTFKTSQIRSVIEDNDDSLPPLSPRQLYRPEKQEKRIRRGGKPDSTCTYKFPRDSKSKNKPPRFRGDICGEKCFKPRADEHHTLPLSGAHKRTKKPVMTGATNSYGFTEGIPVSEESSIVGKLVPTDQLPKLAQTGVHVSE